MAADERENANYTIDHAGRPRERPLYWVLQALMRVVPVIVVMRASFEVMLRNDWFVWNPHLEPGQIAMLFAFMPAGIWAIVDGYRLVPTGQVVALWAVVGAAVVFVNHLIVGLYGFSQGVTLTLVEIAQWAGAAQDIALLHAAPAALLVLLGAGLYRYRNSRTSS